MPEFVDVLKAVQDRPGGDRRSPLHLAMGPRFPPGLPRDGRRDRSAGPAARAGADRHRDRGRGRRHRPPARAAAHERHQHRHLPAEPALPRAAGDQPRRKAAGSAAPGARDRGQGHRLRRHRQGGRRDVPPAGGGRRIGHDLPRQAARGRAQGQPGPVHERRAARDGRHQRLRHGHRQARHALRDPPADSRQPGSLLPGIGPRRPRRPGRRVHAAVPAGRQARAAVLPGQALPDGRRDPRRLRGRARRWRRTRPRRRSASRTSPASWPART